MSLTEKLLGILLMLIIAGNSKREKVPMTFSASSFQKEKKKKEAKAIYLKCYTSSEILSLISLKIFGSVHTLEM